MPSLPMMALSWFFGLDDIPASKTVPDILLARITSFEPPASPGPTPGTSATGYIMPMRTPETGHLNWHSQAIRPNMAKLSWFRRLTTSLTDFALQHHNGIIQCTGFLLGSMVIFIAFRKTSKLKGALIQAYTYTAEKESEIADKVIQIAEKDSDIELFTKLADVRGESIGALTVLNEGKISELRALQDNMETAMEKLQVLSDHSRNLEAENESLGNSVDAQAVEMALLRQDEQTRDTMISDLYDNVAIQGAEITKLKYSETAKDDAMAVLHQENLSLEEQVQELRQAQEEKGSELEDATFKIADLLTEIEDWEKKAEILDTHNRTLGAETASANAKVSDLETQIKFLENEHRQLSAKLKESKDNRDVIQTRFDELQDLFTQMADERDQLRKQRDDARKDFTELQEGLEAADIHVNEQGHAHVHVGQLEYSSASSSSEKTAVELDTPTPTVAERDLVNGEGSMDNIPGDKLKVADPESLVTPTDDDHGEEKPGKPSPLVDFKGKIGKVEQAVVSGLGNTVIFDMLLELAETLYPEIPSSEERPSERHIAEAFHENEQGAQQSEQLSTIHEEREERYADGESLSGSVRQNNEAPTDVGSGIQTSQKEYKASHEKSEVQHTSEGSIKYEGTGTTDNGEKAEDLSPKERLGSPKIVKGCSPNSEDLCEDNGDRDTKKSVSEGFFGTEYQDRREQCPGDRPQTDPMSKQGSTKNHDREPVEENSERSLSKLHIEADQEHSRGPASRSETTATGASVQKPDILHVRRARNPHINIINERLTENNIRYKNDQYARSMGRPQSGEKGLPLNDGQIDMLYEMQVVAPLRGPSYDCVGNAEEVQKALETVQRLHEEISSDEFGFEMWNGDGANTCQPPIPTKTAENIRNLKGSNVRPVIKQIERAEAPATPHTPIAPPKNQGVNESSSHQPLSMETGGPRNGRHRPSTNNNRPTQGRDHRNAPGPPAKTNAGSSQLPPPQPKTDQQPHIVESKEAQHKPRGNHTPRGRGRGHGQFRGGRGGRSQPQYPAAPTK